MVEWERSGTVFPYFLQKKLLFAKNPLKALSLTRPVNS